MIRLGSIALLIVWASSAIVMAAAPGSGQPDDRPHFTGDFQVVESAGPATIEVARPSSATPVTVSFFTEAFEAQPGSDYEYVSGSLAFAPGETLKTFQVQIINDPVEEDDESLNLLLQDAAGKTIDFSELKIISDEIEAEQQLPGSGGGSQPPPPGGTQASSGPSAAPPSSRPGTRPAGPSSPEADAAGLQEPSTIILSAGDGVEGEGPRPPKGVGPQRRSKRAGDEDMPLAAGVAAAGLVALAVLALGYQLMIRKGSPA
ncbi:MAG: Calx-beta domain-containing protein [Actinomycetota bacterium]